MKFFYCWLKTNQDLLKTVLKTAEDRNVKLYLVGGVLRDIILKKEKENPDLDFCLKKGAINFARILAGKLEAGFVVLDEIHGCGRIVKKMNDKIYTLDFSDFRGKTIVDDLFHRDFSINSMAIEPEKVFSGADLDSLLVDPYGGRQDLKTGVIRIVNKRCFDEDPLRILRAFSMAAIFDMGIEKKTLRLIDLKKNKLKRVSFERIRDEVFKILSTRKCYAFLTPLDKYGILDLIIPEIKKMRKLKQGPYHHLDVWGHSLETVKKLELLMNSLKRNTEIRDYLQEEVSMGRRRCELIKLAALLHDIGKPKTFRIEGNRVRFHGHERVGSYMVGDIAVRLKLSNEEERILRKIIFLHLRPGYMATNPVLTPRARYRFFRDASKEAVSVLLIAWADERATQGYLLIDKIRKRYERLIPRLIREYFIKKKKTNPERLVNGNDLMQRFKLEPSPLIGKILRELEELQAIGKIKTKTESLKVAARIIKPHGGG
jgi:putative nucleotidyltransferase with HDIG domain